MIFQILTNAMPKYTTVSRFAATSTVLTNVPVMMDLNKIEISAQVHLTLICTEI